MQDAALRAAVDRLLALKRVTPELGEGRAIPEISGFLATEIAKLDAERVTLPAPARAMSELDTFFREELGRLF